MAFLLCHRSRLGFDLDGRFHDFDKLPAPALILDFREGPDQPQQLYLFGHGSLLATQRMSRRKGSQIDPEPNLKGAEASRSSTLRSAGFQPLPEKPKGRFTSAAIGDFLIARPLPPHPFCC